MGLTRLKGGVAKTALNAEIGYRTSDRDIGSRLGAPDDVMWRLNAT